MLTVNSPLRLINSLVPSIGSITHWNCESTLIWICPDWVLRDCICDLNDGKSFLGSGINNPTRAIRHGGTSQSSGSVSNIIDYVTTQTKGDSKDFGDLVTARNSQTGCSNTTRGLIIAGQTPTNLNSIEYITIASTGNGTDFGDITDEIDYLGACASSTRGVNAGGQSPTKINNIEYVTIATTGNVTDFGDLTNTRRFCQGFSDCHGGLG